MAVLQCCVWLLAEMPLSRAAFDLNNRKSGVNRHMRFCQFPKNSEVCRVGFVLFIKPWYHTLHISELKYAPTHGTFPSFLEIDTTAGAYSLQICDYLSQIQRETKSFLQIVRHNTEGPKIPDWQWRHRTIFFFVGLKNRVNLALFFKGWLRSAPKLIHLDVNYLYRAVLLKRFKNILQDMSKIYFLSTQSPKL